MDRDFRYHWDEYAFDPAAARSDDQHRVLAREADAAADVQAAALKASLDATPPEMRRALADQLRVAGMHIPDEWL